jgi:hypothetical protein
MKYFVSYTYVQQVDAVPTANGDAKVSVCQQIFGNSEVTVPHIAGIAHLNEIAKAIGHNLGLTGPVTIISFAPFDRAEKSSSRLIVPGGR